MTHIIRREPNGLIAPSEARYIISISHRVAYDYPKIVDLFWFNVNVYSRHRPRNIRAEAPSRVTSKTEATVASSRPRIASDIPRNCGADSKTWEIESTPSKTNFVDHSKISNRRRTAIDYFEEEFKRQMRVTVSGVGGGAGSKYLRPRAEDFVTTGNALYRQKRADNSEILTGIRTDNQPTFTKNLLIFHEEKRKKKKKILTWRF